MSNPPSLFSLLYSCCLLLVTYFSSSSAVPVCCIWLLSPLPLLCFFSFLVFLYCLLGFLPPPFDLAAALSTALMLLRLPQYCCIMLEHAIWLPSGHHVFPKPQTLNSACGVEQRQAAHRLGVPGMHSTAVATHIECSCQLGLLLLMLQDDSAHYLGGPARCTSDQNLAPYSVHL